MRLCKIKKTSHLLISEAPGCNGCRLAGISFTSEYILSQSSLYGLGDPSDYLFADMTKRQKELSATIVWEQLRNFESLPLIWNIFPLHPYELNSEKSNRTPTKDELKIDLQVMG